MMTHSLTCSTGRFMAGYMTPSTAQRIQTIFRVQKAGDAAHAARMNARPKWMRTGEYGLGKRRRHLEGDASAANEAMMTPLLGQRRSFFGSSDAADGSEGVIGTQGNFGGVDASPSLTMKAVEKRHNVRGRDCHTSQRHTLLTHAQTAHIQTLSISAIEIADRASDVSFPVTLLPHPHLLTLACACLHSQPNTEGIHVDSPSTPIDHRRLLRVLTGPGPDVLRIDLSSILEARERRHRTMMARAAHAMLAGRHKNSAMVCTLPLHASTMH